MIRVRRATTLAVATAIAAGGAAVVAQAGTVAPSSSQKAAIIKAFGDPAAASSCLTVRLSSSNKSYATVRPVLSTRCEKYAFNGVNVLERGAGNRWRVVFEGSSFPCPIAHVPVLVQRDLGICK